MFRDSKRGHWRAATWLNRRPVRNPGVPVFFYIVVYNTKMHAVTYVIICVVLTLIMLYVGFVWITASAPAPAPAPAPGPAPGPAPAGVAVSWSSGGVGCESGTAALWNNKGDLSGERCCPTQNWKNNFSMAWCTELPVQSECIFDFQCTSGYYCSPGDTADSKCVPKAKAGAAVPWARGGVGCESGTAALWNNKGHRTGERCCPTQNWKNNFSVAWCTELPVQSECIFDFQCTSGHYCSPGDTTDSKCVPKQKAGAAVPWLQGTKACESGTAALWNNKGNVTGERCCPTQNWKNNFSVAWCTELPVQGECIFDFQCTSGHYCSPGDTADSKCVPKQKAGAAVPWAHGAKACESGTAALWNNKGNRTGERCCPTQTWKNNFSVAWCTELPVQSECVFDFQCTPGYYCSPGDTNDSKCVPKQTAGVVVPWTQGATACESGSSGLWNDRGAASETRCCPVNGTINNWGKGWCREIPIGGQCIFNDQCESKRCVPEISRDGKCVN